MCPSSSEERRAVFAGPLPAAPGRTAPSSGRRVRSRQRLGFTERIAPRLRDERRPSYVIHRLGELIIQRLYAIAAGYEDQNDADTLRYDGLFGLIAGKDNLDEERASQPSLSRFENSISATEVGQLNELLTERFIESCQHPPHDHPGDRWHCTSASRRSCGKDHRKPALWPHFGVLARPAHPHDTPSGQNLPPLYQNLPSPLDL